MSVDLTQLRLEAGHSIKSFAEATGVHEKSIARLESGKGVHPATAKKIADYLNDNGYEGIKAPDLLPPLEEAA